MQSDSLCNNYVTFPLSEEQAARSPGTGLKVRKVTESDTMFESETHCSGGLSVAGFPTFGTFYGGGSHQRRHSTAEGAINGAPYGPNDEERDTLRS